MTKLPWQTSVRLSAKMATEPLNIVNEDIGTLKDFLENLNTRKSSLNFRRLLRVVFSSQQRLNNASSDVTTRKPDGDFEWLIVQAFA